MNLREFPKILLLKVVLTILVGIACFLFGTAYYFYAADRVFFFLSLFVLAFSAHKALSVYLSVKNGKYDTVEGVCVGVSAKLTGRIKKVRIMDSDGLEITLKLHKSNKIKIGGKYRFYLQRASPIQPGNEYFNTLFAEGNLLGVEFLGELE